MTEERNIKRSSSLQYYLIEGVLLVGWLVYLIKFYSFYKEAYFYTDKKLPLFLKILSLLKENWATSFTYFAIAFLLMALSFFVICFYYVQTKNEKKYSATIVTLLTINLLTVIALCINTYAFIFLIITALAGSLVYITYVIATVGSQKELSEDEEEIEVIGPFDTKEIAKSNLKQALLELKNQNIEHISDEIYLDDDNKYYVDIYVKEK